MGHSARRLATAAACLLLPGFLKRPALRLLGHVIARDAGISASLVLADRLYLAQGARIGFGNIIAVRRVVLRRGAWLGTFNTLKGRFSVCLGEEAFIGNRNVINRGPPPGDRRPARLKLGPDSAITASHYVNVAESVVFGRRSTLAGAGCQLWTHGFVHAINGQRPEIRGRITVGDEVYIGANSCITAGVRIVTGVCVGAHSSVAKDLLHPGTYVSQPLRFIPGEAIERVGRLAQIETPTGAYYWKGDGKPPS